MASISPTNSCFKGCISTGRADDIFQTVHAKVLEDMDKSARLDGIFRKTEQVTGTVAIRGPKAGMYPSAMPPVLPPPAHAPGVHSTGWGWRRSLQRNSSDNPHANEMFSSSADAGPDVSSGRVLPYLHKDSSLG